MTYVPRPDRRVRRRRVPEWLRRRRTTDVGRRDWMLRATPQVLIEYPAEVLLAGFALLSGPPALLKRSAPDALEQLLPHVGRDLWAVCLTAAGALIVAGLCRSSRGIVAVGLRLLGTACLVYSVALWWALGAGIPAVRLLAMVSLLCYFRAWWLRESERIHARVRKAGDEDWPD